MCSEAQHVPGTQCVRALTINARLYLARDLYLKGAR